MSSLENLRDLLRDERVPAVAAHVALHAGETSFWFVNDEGDIVISVVTNQHGVELHANLDVIAGGSGRGIYMLPALGDEVLVGFDDGDFEGEVYVISRTTGGGGAPEGLAPGKVVVVGLEVLVHSGDGVCEPLVRKSEFDGHTHGPGSFTTPTGGGGGGPVTGTSGGAASVTGTPVLKA